jgi:hypothetical protein
MSAKCKAWCGTPDLNAIPAEDAAAWWYGVAGSYVCSPACARQGESAAGAEGWKRIDTIGTLWVRVTPPEPPSVWPTMLELRVTGGEGQTEGIALLRAGSRITPTLLGMIADVLELADCTEEGSPHEGEARG